VLNYIPAMRPSPRKGIPHLDGHVALITGAAHGIGKALARGLYERGCHLALVDTHTEGLEALRRELMGIRQERAVTVHAADVGDRERMRVLATEVMAAHRAVHLLVNNAGIGQEAAFPQISLDDWDRIVGTNFWGVIYGCHFFLPHLAKVGRAHIVNLSSLFGIIGMPGQSAYCATKFAVRGFSEALSEELRTTSVGLTVVYPAAVATGIMTRTAGNDPELMERLVRWWDSHGMAPDRAARKIIRAIERGAPRLLLSRDAVIGDVVKRLLPVRGNTLITDVVIHAVGAEDMRAKRDRQWQETMVERSRETSAPTREKP
jgi:short-subunit dehydrogenase